MAIGVNTTLNANGAAIEINTGGSWVISKGKSLTLSSTSTNGVTIASNQTVNITASGDGTGNASLTFSGAVTNNGTLNIGSNVLFSVSNTITNTGSITFSSGATINLDSFQPTSTTLNDSDTTGVKTWSGSWTLATGGTVTAEDGIICQYKGKSATGGSISAGEISATGNYFNIISGDEKTYAEATANDSINFINVLGKLTGVSDSNLTNTIQGDGVVQVDAGDTLTYSTFKTNAGSFTGSINVLGELSKISGTITTTISGSGTISMSAGAGEATIAADKLTGFTGDLVINSGRFKEVKNGHVFSNVTVEDGGQFYLAGNGSYSGSVSIAGTGWDASNDTAKAGALRIGHEATLSGPLTLTDDAVILVLKDDAQGTPRATITGNLNLNGHTLTVKGSTGGLLFGTGVTIGSGEGMVNIVANEALIGVNAGGSLSILKDFTGKGLCSTGAGTITVGNGTDKVVTSVERIELGDTGTAANTTTLTVNANSVLKITGTDNSTEYKTASALLGEWKARTDATISGTLLAESAKLLSGDAGFTLTIGATGIVATQGIALATWKDTAQQITVLLNGGSLILGSDGFTKEKSAAGRTPILTSTGGVIGSYANTMTIASDVSLTSGTTKIDTSTYIINADNNTVTVPTTGATESTITINGIISGGGDGVVLEASGAGKLILGGANTYRGETSLRGAAIQANNESAFGNSKVIAYASGSISGNATITDFIGVEEGVVLTFKENTAITLSNETNKNKGIWIKSGSSVVLEEGASVKSYKVTVSYLNENSKLAAEGSNEGQFGACGHLFEDRLTIKESAISLDDGAVLRNKLDGGTVSSTGNTKIGWLEDNSTYGGGSISSLADTSASGTLEVASDLAVTKSAAIAGTLNIGEKATTAINSAREDGTASSIATLTGSGTLKTTGGTTEVTNASGFSGTLAATGGDIELQSATALALSEVVVSGGSSISGAESYTADKVSIGAGAAGSLVGSLSINTNGTITLDASAGATTETGGTKGLSLSALTTTFADEGTTTTTGSLTLGSDLTLNLLNLNVKQGESLTLFSGVTGVTGVGDMDALEAGSLEANTVFSNLTEGDFKLSYSNNIVALVAQRDVPEPTTATLSLLALMGMAARRRRRKA